MATRRDALIRRRAARGFTQESLAEHLRVERSTVGRWERGVGTPQSWIQPRLARALEVSLDKLAILLDPDPAPLRSPPRRTGINPSRQVYWRHPGQWPGLCGYCTKWREDRWIVVDS
jgi:transcriptional regulator with XRE-family HTH domain